MRDATCPTCAAPVEFEYRPVAATAGESTVEVQTVETFKCKRGHNGASPTADEILDELAAQLTIAGRRRLRRTDVCGACAADLTMPSRQTETPVPVVVADRVVTVLVQCAMTRCPECGQEQVGTSVWKDVGRATRAAMESARDTG